MREFFKKPANYLPVSGLGLDILKIMAAVFMVVDHLTHIHVIPEVWSIYLGRSVYPIFCYAMACHFLQGRINFQKHSLRLLFFGILAQPPYWLLLVDQPGLNLNIMFTLLLAMFVFGLLRFIGGVRAHLLILLFLVAGKVNIGVSYDLVGVILPTVFFLFLRGDRMGFIYLPVALFLLNAPYADAFTYSWWVYSLMCLVSAAMVMAVSLYFIRDYVTPETANKRILPRWFLYWYYPLHLFAILLFGLWLEQQMFLP